MWRLLFRNAKSKSKWGNNQTEKATTKKLKTRTTHFEQVLAPDFCQNRLQKRFNTNATFDRKIQFYSKFLWQYFGIRNRDDQKKIAIVIKILQLRSLQSGCHSFKILGIQVWHIWGGPRAVELRCPLTNFETESPNHGRNRSVHTACRPETCFKLSFFYFLKSRFQHWNKILQKPARLPVVNTLKNRTLFGRIFTLI